MNADEDVIWPEVPPPRLPPWTPGRELAGRTADWSREIAAMAEERRRREVMQAPEPSGPRHARRHALIRTVARWAETVLIALGTFALSAGTAVREWTGN